MIFSHNPAPRAPGLARRPFALFMPACAALLTLATWQVRAAHAADNSASPAISSRSEIETATRDSSLPSDEELVRSGAIIGTIPILPQQIFDTENPKENTALFRVANRLHIRTRVETIRSQLLFSTGQPYDPRKFAESERLLRQSRYLYDAKVRPVAVHDGKVDVEVITRDVWTTNPGASFGRSGGTNTSGFELEELNLLGTGARISFGYKSGIDRTSKLVVLGDRQLFGTWWSGDALYSDNSDGKRLELILDHPFYSLDTRWATGVTARDDNRIDSRYDLGDVSDEYRTRAKYLSVYGGYSAGLQDGWVRRYTYGFTSDDSRFENVTTAAPTRNLPVDRKLQYPWIGIDVIQDSFIEARNRDQIARTEDFFLGWRASAQLGYAATSLGSDRNAVMLRGSLGKGLDPGPKSTLLLSISGSGRFESGELRNGLASASARWYLRQSDRRLFFTTLVANISSKLDADQQLLSGGDNGLRGYPLRYQAGSGNWLFTAEQRYFTNWYPFRLVHVGGAIFADVGRSFGSNPFGSPSLGLLKDVGFGLRLGNSRSGLGNMLHIDVAFPLDGDSSIKHVQFLVETKRSF